MDTGSLIVIAVAGVGAAIDLRTGRIPNILTFGAAGAGLAFHAFTDGIPGLAQSAGGWAVGVGFLAPLFMIGGMGAGDLKLLGAVGAWLGPAGAFWGGVYSTFAGGLLGIVVGAHRGYLKQALRNVWGLIGFWRVAGIQPAPGLTLEDSAGPRLAYGVAIATGAVTAVFVR